MIYGNKMTMLNVLCAIGLSGCATFSITMNRQIVPATSKSDGVVKRSENSWTPVAKERLRKAKDTDQDHLTPMKKYVEQSERRQQEGNPNKKSRPIVVYASGDATSDDESYESAPKKRKLTQRQLNQRVEKRAANKQQKEEDKNRVNDAKLKSLTALYNEFDRGEHDAYLLFETEGTAEREAKEERAQKRALAIKRALAKEQEDNLKKIEDAMRPAVQSVPAAELAENNYPDYSVENNHSTFNDHMDVDGDELGSAVFAVPKKNTRANNIWTPDAQNTLEASKNMPRVKADGRSGVPQRLKYDVNKRLKEKNREKDIE